MNNDYDLGRDSAIEEAKAQVSNLRRTAEELVVREQDINIGWNDCIEKVLFILNDMKK